jgi:hypothetical protein
VASLARAIASVRAQDTEVQIIVADTASEVEVRDLGDDRHPLAAQGELGQARNLGLKRVETGFVVSSMPTTS